jgi:hypothetical protein
MAPLLAPPLPPGCPWSGFTPPNVDWCEAELCAWVTNPANTWSNLLYLVLGVVMWRQARRRQSHALSLFGPASIAVGVFSLIYHASYTWFLQFFDFVGMFLFCFVVLTLNARRLGWIAPQRQTAFYGVGVALFSGLVPVLFSQGIPIQGLVLILILTMIGQELVLKSRASPPRPDYRLWYAALAAIGLAATLSLLDVTRTWCDPDNHWIQGHAFWHILTALGLYALFHFYAGLDLDRHGSAPV